MTISVIVIGKNNAKTLSNCLISVNKAIKKTTFVEKAELIYVDSHSTDQSVQIAEENQCQVIKITDGFTSAALGRSLGKLAASYQTLLFLDGDMELNADWLVASQALFEEHRALRGKRHELVYQGETLISENNNFDKIETIKPIERPGGFLMIDNEVVKNVQFNPDLIDEEETDFYAKIVRHNKIYQVPIPAYKHYNYKSIQSKILNYISPFKNIGYLVSLLKSIKNGYFSGYFLLQKKYILAILAGILFYGAFIFNQPLLLVAWGLIGLNNIGLRFRSVVLTSVFLPYKFVCALIFMTTKKKTLIVVNNISYSLNVSNPDFSEIENAMHAQKI